MNLLGIIPPQARDRPHAMNRYAAKLLFQFRVDVDGAVETRRLCEERIILIRADTARAALTSAKRIGKSARHSYKNADGKTVRFEFIGVMELIELGSECDRNEAWYEFKERTLPMERREKLIPPESRLRAIQNESDHRHSKRGSRR